MIFHSFVLMSIGFKESVIMNIFHWIVHLCCKSLIWFLSLHAGIMKVASFNVQKFGKSKLSDPFVLKTLIKAV